MSTSLTTLSDTDSFLDIATDVTILLFDAAIVVVTVCHTWREYKATKVLRRHQTATALLLQQG